MIIVGSAPDGSGIIQITLQRAGLSATLLTWGACLQDLRLETHPTSLVLGYRDVGAYLSNPNYFGATIGRFANRLVNGRAVVQGKAIQADQNTSFGHHIHGGHDGASAQNWQISESSNHHVVFELSLPDGHMGFPGSLHVLTTYRLLENQTLEIEIKATCDAETLCSFCHHSYFNLTGANDISNHHLQVFAENYLPVKSDGIPTGEIVTVAETEFDFRHAKELAIQNTLDHNFCLSDRRQTMREIAILSAPKQKISMHISSTEPGLQIYTGHGIDAGGPIGHNSVAYVPNSGIALEPQLWPDAPNHPNFPSAKLTPNETYRQVSRFAFRQG